MRLAQSELQPLPIPRRPERPLFAIGDIHGYSEPLAALLAHLDRHIAQEYGGQDVDLVFLGDLIDRGPDPIGVLTLARAGLGRSQIHETALMGNHDCFLVAEAELAGRSSSMTQWTTWMSNGGRETQSAMGFQNPFSTTSEMLRQALGADLCGFLSGLQLTFRSGEILCAHAGVDPARTLEEQIELDLIWIREPFLSLAADPEAPWTIGATVVHGHTPDAYGVFAHRIGVDTGGFRTGIFAAVEIWDGAARFHYVASSE